MPLDLPKRITQRRFPRSPGYENYFSSAGLFPNGRPTESLFRARVVPLANRRPRDPILYINIYTYIVTSYLRIIHHFVFAFLPIALFLMKAPTRCDNDDNKKLHECTRLLRPCQTRSSCRRARKAPKTCLSSWQPLFQPPSPQTTHTHAAYLRKLKIIIIKYW